MQTSRFQLGLLAALSVVLGLSLSSPQAIGYPSGPAVSYGANPVRSATGHWDLSSATTTESDVISAPADQDLVLTEVVIGVVQNSNSCFSTGRFQLKLDSGETLANLPITTTTLSSGQNHPVHLSFDSGLRVPAGMSVSAQWDFVMHSCGMTQYDLDYVVSGYLATP